MDVAQACVDRHFHAENLTEVSNLLRFFIVLVSSACFVLLGIVNVRQIQGTHCPALLIETGSDLFAGLSGMYQWNKVNTSFI
jgi:hypothetical protein